MYSHFVVVVHVRLQRMTKVPFSEDHDMIDAFPSDRADQPFGIGILPWRSRRSWLIANTHGAHAPGESLTIDVISIASRYVGAWSHPQASVSWRATHSAVGCAVTPIHKTRR